MIDLGTIKPGSTIRIPFSSFDKDDGSSITMTNYAAADILIYKDGSTTERASTNGFTATTDFDSKTGKHLAVIDSADNTTAGFFAAGSEYLVAIDAVTVDSVTTGGWIARFRIGFPGALLDTTIATLSTQTSFTLTAGPAEDDALNGWIAIIHDVASAVQEGHAVVLDYTGSTKTVTLAAGTTFTAAASDNISFFPPVNLYGIMGALVSATTAQLGVNAVQFGGQTVSAAAGVTMPATVASTTNITAGTITTVTNVTNAPTNGDLTATMKASVTTAATAATPTAAAVTARVTANVDQIGGSGQSLTDLKDFADTGYDPSTHKVAGVVLTDTVTTYTGNTPQTGDTYALANGANGFVATKADTAAILDDTGTSGVVVAAASKTGYRLSSTGVADIWAQVIEGTWTAIMFMRLVAASLFGKLSGAATTTVTIRDVDDTKDRIVATVDANGNRSAFGTLDGT